MYRLEVHHNVEVEPPPDLRPLWKKVLGVSKPFGGSYFDTVGVDPLPGRSESLDDAYEAADNSAAALTGRIPDESPIVITDDSTDEEIDGVYPNNGGRF